MVRSISNDLRKRVVEAMEAGGIAAWLFLFDLAFLTHL